jgi:hypothetical protein
MLAVSASITFSRFQSITPSSSSNQLTVPLTEKNLHQTEVIGFDEYGQKLTFQIRKVEVDPKDPQGEVYLYTVFFRDANKTWQNLCHSDAHFPAKAVVLQGRWDNRGIYHSSEKQVTFSCANGALGKCLRFGYKPWKTLNGISLRDYHQTCLRLVRADYCGDGIGHTKNGTPINIYDSLGIQKPDKAPDMSFEAAWGINGAQCINHVRWAEGLSYVKKVCPERLAAQVKNANSCTTATQAQSNFPHALMFNDSIVRNLSLN